MATKKSDAEFVHLTQEQQDQIVEQRLRDAERQLFDAQLNVEIEEEALADLPQADRDARLDYARRSLSEAQGRVKALRRRAP